jgi:hypothetical protein
MEEGDVYGRVCMGVWVCWRYVIHHQATLYRKNRERIPGNINVQTEKSGEIQQTNSPPSQWDGYPAVGPLLGAAFVQLAQIFNTELSTFVSGAQGGMIAGIAVGSLVFNSLAVKFGKRPVYLGTTLGLMASSFWSAEAKSFPSFVAARVLGGLCMAPMEALIPASIADIWLVLSLLF